MIMEVETTFCKMYGQFQAIVSKLEKALEEKTRGVETAMAIARRQIAYQEERYARLVEEHEALRARVGETSE